MDKFERCNKISGIHYLKIPIEDLEIRLTIKSINNVLPLPKLENFTSENKDENLETSAFQEYREEKSFKWQEKVFSSWEENFYTDSHNCTSERDEIYHERLKNLSESESNSKLKMFTYLDGDDFHSEPLTTNSKPTSLATQLEILDVKSPENLGSEVDSNSSSSKLCGLVREPAVQDIGLGKRVGDEMRKLQEMHIMLDWSEKDSESNYIIKRETRLASLWWDPAHCCLIIWPDVNDICWNPYSVEVMLDSRRTYNYSLELVLDKVDDEIMETKKQLEHFVKSLYQKLQLRTKTLNFILPPQSVTRYFVTLQITSAQLFEYDNLYVEYEVRFPSSCVASEEIRGRTHVARVIGKNRVAKYGHLVDFHFDYQSFDEEHHKSPIVYFEVISRDYWRRHRTEGYCYSSLPMKPGIHGSQLSCSRPVLGNRHDEMRRFFVGGYHVLEDLSWLAIPENHQKKTLNKVNVQCISTGTLNIQSQIISQSQNEWRGEGDVALEQLPDEGRMSADTLFHSVNVVLHQYRKARDRLWKCTNEDGSGEGTSSMYN